MLLNGDLDRPYNDLGVPGATTLDFLKAYGSATSQSPNNPFFDIVLRGERFGNATMLRQAIRLDPEVLTVWIGNNDILGGITSGRVVEGVTVRLTEGYNAYLLAKASANPKRITLVDANRLLNDLKDGQIPGISGKHPLVDPAGTAFGLDGIHPNGKGYRKVAELFLEAINKALHKKYRIREEGDCPAHGRGNAPDAALRSPAPAAGSARA